MSEKREYTVLKQAVVTLGTIVCIVSVAILAAALLLTPAGAQNPVLKYSKLVFLAMGFVTGLLLICREVRRLCSIMSMTGIGAKMAAADKRIEQSGKEAYLAAKIVSGVFLWYFAMSLASCYVLDTSMPFVVIMSNSMYPTLERGDMAIVSGDTTEINVGDIIVFNAEGTNIIHRVAEIKQIGDENYYITKGDNNAVSDLFSTPKNRIIGKVVGVIPLVGHISLLFRGC
jgi:signal peptidase I